MELLERLNQVNDVPVTSVYDPAFAPFGRVVTGYDFSGLIGYMENCTEIPENGNIYKPSIPEMEALPVMEQVKNVVGFMPDGYALVNLSAFVEAVDLLGGLDFDVPMDMDYDDPDQNLFIHLKAGEQHLTGEQLMWVVRFRSGYANADIGRTEVQRAVMKTAMKQWLRPKTLAALPGLWRIYQENLTTDLSVRNIVWMARVLLKGMSGDIEANVLPGYATMAGDASVYMIDP